MALADTLMKSKYKVFWHRTLGCRLKTLFWVWDKSREILPWQLLFQIDEPQRILLPGDHSTNILSIPCSLLSIEFQPYLTSMTGLCHFTGCKRTRSREHECTRRMSALYQLSSMLERRRHTKEVSQLSTNGLLLTLRGLVTSP